MAGLRTKHDWGSSASLVLSPVLTPLQDMGSPSAWGTCPPARTWIAFLWGWTALVCGITSSILPVAHKATDGQPRLPSLSTHSTAPVPGLSALGFLPSLLIPALP